MDEVARLAPQDRSDLFRAAAEIKGVTVQIIEKDFWVCWVLRRLEAIENLPADLIFKGGTSLSKVFGVIERMSEDIDLVIDRAGLGFTVDLDPSAPDISGHERERRIASLKDAAAKFVESILVGSMRASFGVVLGASDSWSLEPDLSSSDNTLIRFGYPTVEAPSAYLRPVVQLELGTRGDAWPTIMGRVRPYAAEILPTAFREPSASVRTLAAERTFWEKATILHAVAHQEPARAARSRPARHYYDLHRLWQHGIGQVAASDHRLLADVVRHKTASYRNPKARYEAAVPGSLRLVPGPEVAAAIEPEFATMSETMIFGEAPTFETVLRALAEVEASING